MPRWSLAESPAVPATARMLLLYAVLACAGVAAQSLLAAQFAVVPLWLALPPALFSVWIGASACNGLGRAFPLLRAAGVDALTCILVPSYLVFRGLVPADVIKVFADLMADLDLLNWAVIIFVLGGVASVDRATLARTGLRLILPVIGASLAALAVGGLVAALFFADSLKALELHVIPIMSGGIAAGALPLSMGLAPNISGTAGEALARMLPSIVMANLLGILLASLLGQYRAATLPHQPTPQMAATGPARVLPALAVVAALYLGMTAAEWLFGLPAPFTLVVLILLMVATNALPADLRAGAVAVSDFTGRHVLFPLLWLVGMVIIPWGHIQSGLSPEIIGLTVAVMAALAAAGWGLARGRGLIRPMVPLFRCPVARWEEPAR